MGCAVKTTCPYCGVGCGVLASHRSDGSVSIEGDPDHPANLGRLCSKGSALGETVDLEGRLLTPEIRGERASWDKALDLVAATFARSIAEHGPDSVAFYVSGQILTEDYYAANKLIKGYIGTANIDTNSRLCMASSVAGHRRAFGTDTVPGCYEDLELADVILLVGSNLLWCHPVLYQRIAAAKAQRPDIQVVLIDPRRTKTADLADMHLALEPDSDAALFNGLLRWLNETGSTVPDWISAHTSGFTDALEAAAPWTISRVAEATGLEAASIEAFYRLWAGSEKVVTTYSQGVNQSAVGTDKVNSIINCHLATARIGRPGMGPFSLTGQPNAMGGREVGGLANMLACHMDIENASHRDLVQQFWQSPTIASKPGLKAVDLFKAVGSGKIKALWIMATNPAVSMPEADNVESALRNCPFVVVSDVVRETDTLRHAHVKLPSLAWGEKDGTVTNSERRISRQRTFLPAPGEARADWWQMAQIGQRMGFKDAFNWPDVASVYREYAALTACKNNGQRDLDLGAHADITTASYDNIKPFQWPRPAHQDDRDSHHRFFADGGFYTPDRRARFLPVIPPATARPGDLRLNTGRVRDHWHTMTRTAKSPKLCAHLAEPFCEIHPNDAEKVGVSDADLLRLENDNGAIIVRTMLSTGQKPGNIFVPMHWNGQTASSARVDVLVDAVTDPVSGQPASKGSHVRAAPAGLGYYGFAVSVTKPITDQLDYWALATTEAGWRLEFALARPPADKAAFFARLLGAARKGQHMSADDNHRNFWRGAIFDGTALSGAAYLSLGHVEVARSWAAQQLTLEHSDINARWRVLAGRPANNMPEKGAIICACMGVGANEIADAVRNGHLTVDAVGKATCAGTNCGSCKAEIAEIIHEHRLIAAE